MSAAESVDGLMARLGEGLVKDSASPLYRQIAGRIEKWIEEGVLKPGARLVSERRMTEILTVSRRTVRAALADLIEKKYISSTHGRGNFVLAPARDYERHFLALERFRMEDLKISKRFIDAIDEMEKKFRASMHYKYVRDNQKLSEMLNDPPGGYLGILMICPPEEWIAEIASRPDPRHAGEGLPLLVVNRDLRGRGLNYVSSDHRLCGELAAEHLISLGHRRIGYACAYPESNPMANARLGFETTLRKHGLELLKEDMLLCGLGDPVELQRAYENFLVHPGFSALVVAGSMSSVPFEKAAQRSGLAIPDQMSVVMVSEPKVLHSLVMRWTAVIYPDKEVINRGLEVLTNLSMQLLDEPVGDLLPPGFTEGATAIPLRQNGGVLIPAGLS